MGAKGKKKHAKRSAPFSLFLQAERALGKRQFKQALKDAKVCYRQQPSDEHRKLLEQSYVARADDLFRSGMLEQAQGLIDELTALGTTDPAVKQQLADLMMRAGLLEQRKKLVGRDVTPEERMRLETEAADQAVLDPKKAPPSLPAVRAGAQKVRAALEALEAGNEDQAIAGLQDIPRSSPFADWKLFVRGLAAYYREDTAEMLANWDRLDPNRRAIRIAGPLKQLAAASTDIGNEQFYRAARLLESETTGFQAIGYVREMRREISQGDWDAVLATFRRARTAFRRGDRDLLNRIVRVLSEHMIRNRDVDAFEEFTEIADPPALDPNWNRLWALIWEVVDEGEYDLIESRWLDYLDDLADLASLSQAERTLAQALVWARLGRLAAEQYIYESDSDWFDEPADDLEELQDQAVERFEKSLALAPGLESTYLALAAYQLDWEQDDKAAETYRRLLEQHPHNLEALVYLCEYHGRRDEPMTALDYALQAVRLKPLDERITRLVWAAHLEAARHYAMQKNWDEGRRAFTAAEKLDPAGTRRLPLLVRRAVFEWKAGDDERGEEFFAQAQDGVSEPTAALLAAAAEASRYRLPRERTREFQREWKKALKNKCNSQTAAEMCRIMSAYLHGDVKYTGRPEHVRELFAYLRRMTRVKFREQDLRVICEFIDQYAQHHGKAEQDEKVLQRYVKKGTRQFPGNAYFQYRSGELEIEKGPYLADRRHAQRSFQRALELAEDSGRPEDADLRKKCKDRLTFLDQMGVERPGFGPPPSFGPPSFGPELGGGPPIGSPVEMGKIFNAMIEMAERMGINPDMLLDEMERAVEDGMPFDRE
jgi:tetratricopeptide (TPR) repeat protein